MLPGGSLWCWFHTWMFSATGWTVWIVMNFGPVAILIETFQSSHGLAWIVDSVADGRKTFDHTSLMRKTHGELGKVHTDSWGFHEGCRDCRATAIMQSIWKAIVETARKDRKVWKPPKLSKIWILWILWCAVTISDHDSYWCPDKCIHGIWWLQAPDPPKPQAVNSYNDEQHRGQAFFNWFGFTTTGSSARILRRKYTSWGDRTLVAYLGSLISFDVDTLHMY